MGILDGKAAVVTGGRPRCRRHRNHSTIRGRATKRNRLSTAAAARSATSESKPWPASQIAVIPSSVRKFFIASSDPGVQIRDGTASGPKLRSARRNIACNFWDVCATCAAISWASALPAISKM